MTPSETARLLSVAVKAAHAAGELLRRHLRKPKQVSAATQHDIKLELDVRCQKLIERHLQRALPAATVLGEEGVLGDPQNALRWVVDPIDGTVNFTYGVPHACVSIALQERGLAPATAAPGDDPFNTLLGVVYDPFTDELWTATAAGPARLNRRVIRVAERSRLDEAIVALGFAKDHRKLERMLPVFDRLVHRVRKIRIMGAAALSMTYVATGRFDGYVEGGVRLWDIAAGGLIVERAGGIFRRRLLDRDHTYEILVSNPALEAALRGVAAADPP